MAEKFIIPPGEKLSPEAEHLIAQIREKLRNLYLTRQYLCAEATLLTLNNTLGGGLTETQAVAMAAPFCVAMGDSGCLCGALSGAIMAVGLLIGGDQPYRRRRELRESARQLYDAFKSLHGSTCCRILIRNVKDDRQAHFQQCADLTAKTTELAARLILQKRPELLEDEDRTFTAGRQTLIRGLLLKLVNYLAR